VVQLRSDPEIPGAGNALGHLLHKVIHTALMLNNHHGRNRAYAVWLTDVEAHGVAIDLDTLPH
jgi:hypothetical protein